VSRLVGSEMCIRDSGITISGNGFAVTATTMVASKSFAWEAIG
jgi:hypothetical protein